MTDPTAPLARLTPLLPLLARFLFAAVLLRYFWASALTKIGDGSFGFLHLSAGAYGQIFPRAFEAVGYDASQMSWLQGAIALGGTWAEFLLPMLILLGLLSRPASLAMIGFILVQTLTDLYGHGLIADAPSLGAWFDRDPGSIILDQRALWVMLLLVPGILGGGALSLDRLLFRHVPKAQPAR
ncbi:hypothetical protein [Pseudooceanicola algae]|uniref:DoxX n=1 Tax=Pseudooceanicola algae TaxID=1537215 RepID=A0A418SGN8_9RHOB|nr:hypothetical protein [Pseudooceanicola algae]QPM88905.1 hypothetical protein PSAL_001080 [Pseudooceanicola algae]